MTDLEISKALALAIGWRDDQVSITTMSTDGISWIPACVNVKPDGHKYGRPFWYTDWEVIGPIAERFNCFPGLVNYGTRKGLWVAYPFGCELRGYGDTPQKAIALAVIGAKK
jgi:hypothetical protein